jgi:hypothetical protein
VVTFQLTPDGERKLSAAGITAGNRFQRAILLDLYRSGDAFTYGSGVDEPELATAAQIEMDFSNDPEPEALFPACSDCGSVDDLHLTTTTTATGPLAKLQCPKCRTKTATSVDASIPIPLLSLPLLKRLFVIKPVTAKHDSVNRLHDLFQAELQSKWEALRKPSPALQPSLLDNPPKDELNLGK